MRRSFLARGYVIDYEKGVRDEKIRNIGRVRGKKTMRRRVTVRNYTRSRRLWINAPESSSNRI